MKYPALYVYTKTADKGMELRRSLRSLKNVKNWNSQVFLVGESEEWFKNIVHISAPRLYGNPQKDVENKMHIALTDERCPEDFIFMNDDIYVTEPCEVEPMHYGPLTGTDKTYHLRAKKLTAERLMEQGIKEPLNYELHTPMIMNKEKRLSIRPLIMSSFNGTPILPRSVYGNLFNIGGKYYEDQKTKGDKLKKGVFISTQYYTDELDKLFPEESEFEL